jgi:uncharacterized protein (TIGR02145 family)
MRKFLLSMMLCCPAMLAAQNGVTVSNLAVNAGSPSTVTFNVSWKSAGMSALWSDTVWVFVDYNKNGRMERLPLSPGATLTATSPGGQVIEEIDNNKGVWVAGNARDAGTFSATVQLLTATANLAGVCAYASNYPPVGEYLSATKISFTGTPMYNIILKDNGDGTITRESGKLFSVPDGYTVQSFTDKTGAPGIMKCIVPATYTLQVSALDFCAGSEGVQFALDGTEAERRYQLFRNNSAIGAVLDGMGNAATFTGSFNETGTYTAHTVADELYCATAMDRARVVSENPLPAIPNVISVPRQCPGTVTLSASSLGAVIDWYLDAAATTPLYAGASYTTPEIETSTTYYVQARVEASGCLSARVPVLATVITEGCCTVPGSTVNFTAFDPCSNAATGDYWYLTDTRESNNIQTYKVKKMADGRIWMVQDMKFGDKCNKTTFAGTYTAAGKVSSLPNYYGDCMNMGYDANHLNRGYHYNWSAAMNNPNAGQGGDYSGCSGTASSTSACRGICPMFWHIPTGNTDGELQALYTAMNCTNSFCFATSTVFEGDPYGNCEYNGSHRYTNYMYLWAANRYSTEFAHLYASDHNLAMRDYVSRGQPIRCVRNY